MPGIAFMLREKLQDTGRGLAGAPRSLQDAFDDAYRSAKEPGPPIRYQPFSPGTVSPGSVLAKLGTSIFAAARARANYGAEQERLALSQQKSRLETQKLQRDLDEPRYSFTTPSGEVVEGLTPQQRAGLEPKPAQATPRTPVKLTKPMYGYESGAEVDPNELTQAGQAARHQTTQAGLNARGAARGQAAKKWTAAQAERRNAEDRLDPNGTFARSAYNVATGITDRLLSDYASKDKGVRTKAAALLGVNPNLPTNTNDALANTDKVLQAAAEALVQRFVNRKMVEEGRRVRPRIDAAERVTQEAAGVLGGPGGLAPEDEDFLGRIEELTR